MKRKPQGAKRQPPKGPTLSLCMIVKNEEANLSRCLESVKGVVDEIIVVDTGSTDQTVEIARQHRARVFSHQWNDDFAAARNVSLLHATSDWILVLDADEALAPEDRTPLRKLLRHDGPTAFLLNIVSPVDDQRSSHAVINAFQRLFRNRLGIRFEGRCHEQVAPLIVQLGGTVSRSEIRVHHWGYHSRWVDLSEKRRRNMRLLKTQLAEHPDDPLSHFHLGEVYALEGRLDDAMTCYQAALSLPGLPPTNRSVVRRSLATCLLKSQQFKEAWEECQRALEEDSGYAMPHLTGAIALGKLKQYETAIEQAELYLAKAVRRGRGIHGVLDHEPNLAFAWSFKGECYLALRQIERAEACYRTALGSERDSPEAHLGMGKLFRLSGRPHEAAQAFEKAVALFKDLPQGHLALAEAYAQQERWQEAACAAEAFLKACPQDVEGLTLYAQALLKLKRLHEAEAAYRDLMSRAPSAMAHFALACLADARGDRPAAAQLCRKAWVLERTDPRIPFLLGCCLIDAGDYQGALVAFLEAERLAPSTPEIEQRLRLLRRLLEEDTCEVQNPPIPPFQKGGTGGLPYEVRSTKREVHCTPHPLPIPPPSEGEGWGGGYAPHAVAADGRGPPP